MSKSETDLLNELEEVDLQLKENRLLVKHLRIELLNAETILIGNKIRKEKLTEGLRRLRIANE